ncbi:septation ring formation regulator EzrA [Dubosiella muris]|uniref:Negative regulator of septation ring formation n=2 Tax=Dubosiella TaxID=1937008 RepID=A0AC61RBJ0_9FIRM|nr:septation ring formation regulator EzrA [Dubosiella muris]TGY66919.1 negative regulator of septation ring formation [Dubosiella muris]
METVMNFFRSAYSYISAHLSTELMIYVAIAVLLLILIWIIMRMMKRRKAAKRLAELEIEVNEIRNNALAYKFNKANAFAKANDDIMERIKNLTPKYEICQKSVASCDELFTDADDFIAAHRIRKATRSMDELETMLDDTKERIRIVNQSLDHILARETEVREKSNSLKERFRNVKKVYQDNRASFYSASNYIDSEIGDIENEFSSFEEWMFASEFNKAKEEVDKIASRVDVVSSQIAAYPGLYEKAKNILPRALDEVLSNIQMLKDNQIDIRYLNTDEKTDTIEKALVEATNALDVGNLEKADTMLTDIGDAILELQDDVMKEKKAYDEIHGDLLATFEKVDEEEEALDEIVTLYANIKDRFGLEDWTHRFTLAKSQLADLQDRRKIVEEALSRDATPSVEVVQVYREFAQDVDTFHLQVNDMKRMLVGASSDESRAKKQLVKLQLILNEVRLNTISRNLPSMSTQFADDLKEGERLIQRVRVVLDHSPLDVQTLNADLQDAIDFVYKLYNNANNLVGVAIMVENAIVFGNRFRSTYPAMDSELTHAEVCFQNGEYTHALKIAIQAIENMHPGIYEKLIAKKDPAVMNQV